MRAVSFVEQTPRIATAAGTEHHEIRRKLCNCTLYGGETQGVSFVRLLLLDNAHPYVVIPLHCDGMLCRGVAFSISGCQGPGLVSGLFSKRGKFVFRFVKLPCIFDRADGASFCLFFYAVLFFYLSAGVVCFCTLHDVTSCDAVKKGGPEHSDPSVSLSQTALMISSTRPILLGLRYTSYHREHIYAYLLLSTTRRQSVRPHGFAANRVEDANRDLAKQGKNPRQNKTKSIAHAFGNRACFPPSKPVSE